MNAKERKALLERPVIIMNHRTCYSLKRWAGVIVNDNFGEGIQSRFQVHRGSKKLKTVAPTGFGITEADRATLLEIGNSKDLAMLNRYDEWERALDNDPKAA